MFEPSDVGPWRVYSRAVSGVRRVEASGRIGLPWRVKSGWQLLSSAPIAPVGIVDRFNFTPRDIP